MCFMKQSVDDRAAMLGEYIVKNKATVRLAAGKFGVSKSTVRPVQHNRTTLVGGSLAAKNEKNFSCIFYSCYV